jgi:hypothetical protein
VSVIAFVLFRLCRVVGDREGRSMTLSNRRDANTDYFPKHFVEFAEYL